MSDDADEFAVERFRSYLIHGPDDVVRLAATRQRSACIERSPVGSRLTDADSGHPQPDHE